jgi:hypothetical protein
MEHVAANDLSNINWDSKIEKPMGISQAAGIN